MHAYAHIPHAVAFVELMLCEGPESSWEIMMQAKLSPEEIIETIRFAADDPDSAIPADRRALVVTETHHPEFAQYVAGKMGLM